VSANTDPAHRENLYGGDGPFQQRVDIAVRTRRRIICTLAGDAAKAVDRLANLRGIGTDEAHISVVIGI
jgi:hypothetical protein